MMKHYHYLHIRVSKMQLFTASTREKYLALVGMRKILAFTFCVLSQVSLGLFAQTDTTDKEAPILSQVVPPSPEVATLGKYGELPVSTYTGIPSIEIPIHTVAGREISSPISLSYHAGGIKVEEMASRVGLSWSLNAGGAIMRTMQGLPDEASGGYIATVHESGLSNYNLDSIAAIDEFSHLRQGLTNFQDAMDIYTDIQKLKLDLEPDMFNFNIGGISGKFFICSFDSLTNTGKAYPYPYQDIELTFECKDYGNLRNIDRWIIRDQGGVVYVFGRSTIDTNRVAHERTLLNPSGTGLSPDQGSVPEYTSAWYVTDIIAPSQNISQTDSLSDVISFYYQSYQVNSYPRKAQETQIGPTVGESGDCGMDRTVTGSNNTDIAGVEIQYIRCLGGEVEFVSQDTSNRRTDIPPTSDQSALKEILIKSNEGDTIKKFVLNTSYFNSSSSIWSDKRLKLNSVQEFASIDTQNSRKPAYIFTYNQTSLPNLFSNAQDHWGYYNGKNTNTTLIPEYRNVGWGTISTLPGADRSPDSSFMQAGILTSIKYPTGGMTSFTYEPHRVYMSDFFFETTSTPIVEDVTLNSSSTDCSDINGTRYCSDTFDIDYASTVEVSMWLDDNTPTDYVCDFNGLGSSYCGITVEITRNDTVVSTLTSNYSELTETAAYTYVTLEPGQYKMVMTVNDPGASYINQVETKLSITTQSTSGSTLYNKMIGGLRVAQMVDSKDADPAIGPEDIVTNYYYVVDSDPTKSSGVLTTPPRYDYTEKIEYPAAQCLKYIRTANSQVTLGNTQGSFVGYEQVQIIRGNTETNGKTSYFYTTSPDIISYVYPYAPATTQADMRRGKLHQEINYKDKNLTYSKVSQTVNTHLYKSRPFVTGAKVGCAAAGGSDGCLEPIFISYRLNSEWHYLDSVAQYVNDQDDGRLSLLTTSKTFHDSDTLTNPRAHVQPTRQRIYGNQGRVWETRYTYPFDSIAGTGSTLEKMQNLHMISTPIEESNWEGTIATLNSLKQISGRKNIFQDVAATSNNHPIIRPTSIELFETTASQAGSYEKRASFSYTDDYGMLREQKLEKDVPVTYVYGYRDKLPVAEIVNLSGDSLINISGINLSLIAQTTAKSSMQSLLSSLRTAIQAEYPNARITTFLYNDRMELEEITDINGLTTKYEYDGLSRLIQITDPFNNLVQKTKYHYANQ